MDLPSIGFQDQPLSLGLAARIGVPVYCFIWGVLIAPVEVVAFNVGPHNFQLLV